MEAAQRVLDLVDDHQGMLCTSLSKRSPKHPVTSGANNSVISCQVSSCKVHIHILIKGLSCVLFMSQVSYHSDFIAVLLYEYVKTCSIKCPPSILILLFLDKNTTHFRLRFSSWSLQECFFCCSSPFLQSSSFGRNQRKLCLSPPD